MKVYLAELIGEKTGERVQWTDDVCLVIFYGHHVDNFKDLAKTFNNADRRTAGGAPIQIDPSDNWRIKIIGVDQSERTEPEIETYITADA